MGFAFEFEKFQLLEYNMRTAHVESDFVTNIFSPYHPITHVLGPILDSMILSMKFSSLFFLFECQLLVTLC